jgi:hypothetical protein
MSSERLVVRPMPAVLYLYPSLFAALLCGVVVALDGPSVEHPGATGIVFTLVFFFNLSLLAFDYTRGTSIALVLVAVVIGLLTALYPALGEFLQRTLDQPMFMNATFYWVWSSCMATLLAFAWLRTRFDYWEIDSNEIVHRRGWFGDVERWPAPNVRMTKEIRDVLEYLLFRSGRIVLVPANEQRAIVIDHVANIDRVEARIQTLLGALKVNDGR